MKKYKVTKHEKVSYKPTNEIYGRALLDFPREECISGNWADWHSNNPESYLRYFFLIMKYCTTLPRNQKNITQEYVQSEMSVVYGVVVLLQHITPRELIQMFPIEKSYDGDKYGSKDYFYTMEQIRKIGEDSVLGDERAVFDFLWDYQNEDTRLFLLRWTNAISHVRQLQGGMNPMEEFLQDQGVPTYTFNEKEGYLYNRMTGETCKVQKKKHRIPAHMKVVQGKLGKKIKGGKEV